MEHVHHDSPKLGIKTEAMNHVTGHRSEPYATEGLATDWGNRFQPATSYMFALFGDSLQAVVDGRLLSASHA